MKKNLTLCVALATIALAGCSNDENNPSSDGRVALNVTSGIQTRAHDNTWEADDAIGIYMLNSTTVEQANKQYTTATAGTTGTFAPAATDQTIYFPVDGTTRDLVAYYPHTATIGTDNLYPVNVATQTSQPGIDLMAAAKVTDKSKTDPTVTFTFEHKLVKLDITIKGDGASTTNAELAGTIVKITNQQTTATYNVVDGGNVNVTTATPADITLLTTDLKAEGIVLPSSDTDGMKLTFTVPALNNQLFEWTVKTAEKSQQFEAGKKYKYTITIGKAGLSVSSTVTDWTPGNGEDGENGSAE